MSKAESFNIERIMDFLPHRYPFLLVDRVTEFVSGESLTAYKNVSINEPFFQGHFPGLPVMPGVLVLEALAQAGGVYVMNMMEVDQSTSVFLFTGLNKVRFRRPVVPGDKLMLNLTNIRRKMNVWMMHGVAEVEGEVAAQADLSAAMVDKGTM